MRLLCQLIIKFKTAPVAILRHDADNETLVKRPWQCCLYGARLMSKISMHLFASIATNLRDVLIDRAGEIEVMHKEGLPEEVEQMIVKTIQPFRAEQKAIL